MDEFNSPKDVLKWVADQNAGLAKATAWKRPA
jgi:hypothetical protein